MVCFCADTTAKPYCVGVFLIFRYQVVGPSEGAILFDIHSSYMCLAVCFLCVLWWFVAPVILRNRRNPCAAVLEQSRAGMTGGQGGVSSSLATRTPKSSKPKGFGLFCFPWNPIIFLNKHNPNRMWLKNFFNRCHILLFKVQSFLEKITEEVIYENCSSFC